MLERFTWYKQSAFRWQGDGPVVYIDPWGVLPEDPPADAIFITHAHFDHFQPEEIAKVRRAGTRIVAPADVARELSGEVTPVGPGDTLEVAGVKVRAVPYVLELGVRAYYHAGDTDHAPELDEVTADVAFLPIGGTYTMDAREAAGLARSISPQVAVPMHFGFVVGTPADAERFRREADPVRVEVLTPQHPFERG